MISILVRCILPALSRGRAPLSRVSLLKQPPSACMAASLSLVQGAISSYHLQKGGGGGVVYVIRYGQLGQLKAVLRSKVSLYTSCWFKDTAAIQ
jgi:hypothetical protein